LQSKTLAQAEFISACAIKNRGPHEIGISWGGNMLPAMFLPIAYIPIANWLSGLF